MDLQQQTSKNENPRQSPKDVLANLKVHYLNNPAILRDIELQVDFTNDATFFKSLETFLNDFEDAQVIDKLFHSSIEGIQEEMELYKKAEQGIIKTVNRPVFLINKDQIDIDKTTCWTKPIEENWTTICNVIPSVGRIEIIGDDRRDWAGTGWLLKNTDIVVTNKHVVTTYVSRNKEGAYKIREDWMGDTYGMRIDFKEEHATHTELEFDVKEVIYVAKERELDIALLKIEKKIDQEPQGLHISNEVNDLKKNIFAIGYPGYQEDDIKRDTHFNGLLGVKQFSPGKFSKTGLHKHIYFHDCTTWKGNSGSPIIDFTSGEVLGVHCASDPEHIKGFRTNYAVSGLALREILEELKIPYNH